MQQISYTATVTAKKAVIGFGDLTSTRHKPQPQALRLFSLRPSLGGSMGGSQEPAGQTLRVLPVRQPVEPPPFVWRQRRRLFKQSNWSHIMGKLPTRRLTPRIRAANGQLTTTSRDIAETFGKEHRDVVRRIKAIECSEEFRSAHFCAHPYTDPQNGQTYTEYHITKDGFAFLCMGFTGAKAAAWKERYIAHFNRMAEQLAAKAAKSKQNQPLAHTKPAQSATNFVASAAPLALADHSAAAIGRGLPELPAGLQIPPEIAAQIEEAVIPMAMRCIPALRSYLQRCAYYRAHNMHGWMPERAAAALQSASLADALAFEARAQIQTCTALASALHRIAQQTQADIAQLAID